MNDGFDVNDEINNPATDLPDTDGTEDVNYRDLDDDGDGINTPDEDADGDGNPTNDDSDGDGTPDFLDPPTDQGPDTDGDGVPDIVDLDDDNDGILDAVECGDMPSYGNQSFEEGIDSSKAITTGTNYFFFNEADIPNWETTASDDLIEIWESGALNVDSYAGNYHVELNATQQESALFQEYTSTPGELTSISFAHRGRSGIDTMEVFQGPPGGPYISLGQFSTGQQWQVYNVGFVVPPGQTTSQIRFEAVSSSTGNNGRGNLLDDIYVYEGCADSDNDGVPNRLDLDSDNDGIPDNIEGQTTSGYIAPSGTVDTNGVDTAYEGGITPVNTDDTDNSDYIDLDSDNDSVPDNNEGNDFDFDGIPDQQFTGTDTDGDGLDDGYEGSDVNDGYDVNDEIDDPANDLPDTDGTEDVNYRDIDDDGDDINTPDEDADGDGDPTNDDSDGNGTPDYLDPGSDLEPDTDGDGVPDSVDRDDDNDGILDVVEDPNDDEVDVDTDGDGIPNLQDIDSDNDGIPDNVEAQTTTGYIAPNDDDAATYAANDGLNSAYLPEGLTPVNTDGTDYADIMDLDSDNDSVPDNNEGNDFNFDGVPDQQFTGIDTDGDGLDDGYEGSDVNDGFDVNDEIDDPANDLPDTDGTEDVNYRDLDDDGDGINTPDEDADGDGNPTNDDSDGNGTPDYLQPSDTRPDTDGDGVPDFIDIDDDNDGILDVVEDMDDDGIPIDTDGDGRVNLHDIDSDDDGLPDNVEAQTTAGYIPPNDDDIATYISNNGLNSAYLPNGLTPVNTDGTDELDYIDMDSDNDLVPDYIEGNDFNFDGLPDQNFTGVDTDGDGLDDGYEHGMVDDGFNFNDGIDDPANQLPDTDGTEDVNYRDIDDDGDAIDTPDEDVDGDGDPTNDDTDGDGTPDYLDPVNDNPQDIIVTQLVTPNGDGWNDFLWIENVDMALDNSLVIYNRWGIEVYDGEDYNNQNNVFDGRSRGRSTVGNNSDYLPAGIYYYIFQYNTVEKPNITDNGFLYISQ